MSYVSGSSRESEVFMNWNLYYTEFLIVVVVVVLFLYDHSLK